MRVRGVIPKQSPEQCIAETVDSAVHESAGSLLLRQSGLLFATDAIKARVGGIPLPLLCACSVAKGHPPVKYMFPFRYTQ
jgi:hypothetical protein